MHGVKSVPIDIGPLSVIEGAEASDSEGKIFRFCICIHSIDKPIGGGTIKVNSMYRENIK